MRLLINGISHSDVSKLPNSDALLRGDGLFETILAIDDKPVALDRHLARLERSADKLQITLPASIDIKVGISNLLEAQTDQSKVRLVVLSDGNWFISAEPLVESVQSISLTKFSDPINSKSGLVGIKSISYGQSMLAVRTAHARGYSDGVYLNENNDVVETGSANIIILKDGKFITPALESGCLPGITRQILIKDFAVTEGLFTWDQLLEADAVFLCSSIRLLTPVSKVEDKLFEGSEIGAKLIGEFEQHIRSKIEV